MKKAIFVLFISFLVCLKSHAQVTGSAIYITTTYAQNGNFYIKCVPYDNEEPSLKGKSSVYNKKNKLIYTIDRGFNGLRNHVNFIGISNDGNTLVYVVNHLASEKNDGLSSVSIYRKGRLVKSFTQNQINGCDPKNERCTLLYDNENQIVDYSKTTISGNTYHKVFKDSVPDEEIFLNENAVLLLKDSLFITGPDKLVHIIDIKNENLLGAVPFEKAYPELKRSYKKQKTLNEKLVVPGAPDPSSFPNLINGDTTARVLARILRLKAVYLSDKDYFRYTVYRVNIEAYISRDGTIDIQKLDVDKKLPLDTIKQFFNSHKYDISFIPAGIDKWYFRYFFCAFRNKSDKQAMQEKLQEDRDQLLERERRLTLDSISGVYIPRNLEECFVELDKKLPNVTKAEMMTSKGNMSMYHFGLGTYIRNYWGLWGGSRLVRYFQDHGIFEGFNSLNPDPEELSSMILTAYYNWLNGDKNAAKEWEQKHPLQSTFAELTARWTPYAVDGLPGSKSNLIRLNNSVYHNKGTALSLHGSFTLSDSLAIPDAFRQTFTDARLRQLLPGKEIVMTCFTNPAGEIQAVEFRLDKQTPLNGTELAALENALKKRVVFKLNPGASNDDVLYRVVIKESYQNALGRKSQ